MSAYIRLVDNQFDKRPIRIVADKKKRNGKGSKISLFSSCLSDQSNCTECGNWEGLSAAEVKTILKHYEGKTLAELRTMAGDSFFSLNEDRTDQEAKNYNGLILYRLHFWQDDEIVGETEGVGRNRFSFQLETFNLMGVVRLPHPNDPEKALRMEILSRFDRSGSQVFLNYLLAYVYGFDLVDSVDAGATDFLRILVAVMFVRRLGESVQVGIYRQYREYECNDLDFEGVLDIDRHLGENCPMWDRIAYRKRVIDADVPLNHLLRYALERIHKTWPQVLDANENAREQAKLIVENTPSWGCEDVERIVNARECCTPVAHPYFCEYYEELRLLARMILDGEGFGVYDADEKDEVAGVLFDGAWLWEEYLGTILEPLGFAHFQVGSDDNIEIFQDETVSEYRHMYPDFLYEEGPGKKIVLDAKYKSGRVLRADVQELLSYALITGAQNLGLVFPPREDGSGDTPQYTCSVVEHGLGYLSDNYRPLMWTFQYSSIPPAVKIEEFMSKQEDELRKFAELLKGGTEGLSPRSPDDSR